MNTVKDDGINKKKNEFREESNTVVNSKEDNGDESRNSDI